MAKPRVVIFDIDGTLVDTSEYIYAAFEYALQHHGFVQRTRADIASQIGKKLEECYAFLAPGSEFEAMKAAHDDFQTENIALVKPFEHVNETLQAITQDGMKVVLWTGRNHNVVESLEVAGIDTSQFSMIVTPDDTEHGKPEPDGIIVVTDELKVLPDQVVMVGDADLDIIAGKRAGVGLTVAITHGFGTRAALEAAQPDNMIDSLAELLEIIR